MYWQEDSDEGAVFKVPEKIIDLLFKLNGGQLPVDHAQDLASALCEKIPADAQENLGIHSIRVAESGNGWQRPEDSTGMLVLSRRTKLVLRIEAQQRAAFDELVGTQLQVAEGVLEIGESRSKKLSALTTIFAHGIVCDESESEQQFIEGILAQLRAKNIVVKKLLCGKLHSIQTSRGLQAARSLMLADLQPEDSVLLQQEGLGSDRLLGCGLFIPHKGIEAVYSVQQQQ